MKQATISDPIHYMNSVLMEQFAIDLSQWPELSAHISLLDLKESDHWFRAGDYCHDFAFITSGLLRLYYVNEEGKEVIEGFYERDRLLGPISAFVSDSPCPFYVQALEDTRLVTINHKQFTELSNRQPKLLKFQVELLQSLFLHNAKRDAKRILCNGEQRYQWFCREYPHLIDRVAQYHIASFLRMTPVNLSRLRKRLAQD